LPLRRFFTRSKASALAFLLLVVPPALAEEAKPECAGLVSRLDALVDRYFAAGEAAIQNEDPGPAMERARKAALGGDAEATIRMIGIGLVLRGRQAAVTVPMIRQVCTFADRNGLDLHVVACAYLNALNPLGDRDEKRRAVDAEIARYGRSRPEPQAGRFVAPGPFDADMAALRACLPPA
jgi:hypothetical protein